MWGVMHCVINCRVNLSCLDLCYHITLFSIYCHAKSPKCLVGIYVTVKITCSINYKLALFCRHTNFPTQHESPALLKTNPEEGLNKELTKEASAARTFIDGRTS